jgi:hypothetical protein
MEGTSVLRQFALDHGFHGVDWSFTPANLPRSRAAEASVLRDIAALRPLEVRYHGALPGTDPGEEDPRSSAAAMRELSRLCDLVARAGGRCLTVHVGLGNPSNVGLSWDRTIETLGRLARWAAQRGVCLCLENLASGWTSSPGLFASLVRESGCWATLDIGHARVSADVAEGRHGLGDFASSHPGRVRNGHVYHEERSEAHVPPRDLSDISSRLQLLWGLPLCDWWVVELRSEETAVRTLEMVREFLEVGRRRHAAWNDDSRSAGEVFPGVVMTNRG